MHFLFAPKNRCIRNLNTIFYAQLIIIMLKYNLRIIYKYKYKYKYKFQKYLSRLTFSRGVSHDMAA
ncbi:hypothetical protein GCM10007207_23960 [Asaia siamensis]|uniref:Uncharacterized protein n=1 Tax=Asaia siamensis TaxID=110479 RepID=A0ABQ1MCX7_9PROT|nr:hypothetical protein AA0323_1730 [Asaia siamensis NRIC 0323]GGC37643.1 hypothetical protein GCM10007207_23960 [Asaia siamensis]